VSKHPFRPLRHRAVRLLWGAAVISDIGTWVQLVVVGSLVAAETGSALRTGLVALATFMPQGIASPVGGLLADKFDRRKVFASALVLQAAMTSVLAVVLGLGVRTPSVLTLLILLGSASGALGAPSYSAMQPDLVPPEELMAMVSLGIYSWNSGRVVGPLLGTLLALSAGPAWTIAFNAATFVVMAVAVASLRRPFIPLAQDGTVTERLRDGWRALRSTPGCWHGFTLSVSFNFTVVPFIGLIPIYARLAFHGGTGLSGVFSSAQGLGAISGGIIVTLIATRVPRSRILAWLVCAAVVMLVVYALAPVAAVGAVCCGILGGLTASTFISMTSVVQRDAPHSERGRVMSIMQAGSGGFYGLGLLFTGMLGDIFSLRVAFVTGALLYLTGFVVITRSSRHWRRAVDGAEVVRQAMAA
jgi:MFS family permease